MRKMKASTRYTKRLVVDAHDLKVLLLAILFTIFIAAGSSPVAIAQHPELTDIQGHWAEETIVWAAQHGIVQGYPDGTFLPNKEVREAEFMVMLLNAFPEVRLEESKHWYEKYYWHSQAMNWPLHIEDYQKPILRGQVAMVVAAAQGKLLSENDAVQLLLDQGLSRGKTAATIEGYEKASTLTRAESVQFVRNIVEKEMTLSPTPAVAEAGKYQTIGASSAQEIAIGISEADLLVKLGQPSRKDGSEYGFDWYIYNEDYHDYIQVGVQEAKVVAFYTNANTWTYDGGLGVGSSRSTVAGIFGEPLQSIQKGNTIYWISDGEEFELYLYKGAYVYVFYDVQAADQVTAIQYIEQDTERSLQAFHGQASERLRQSFERQSFDLANAVRVRMGLAPFEWDEQMSHISQLHSEDMALNDFFEHHNLQGETPFDRMEAGGIEYRAAAENIAAGQKSAIFAHEGWMNSPGHRSSILGDYERLGVGVYFGGAYQTYYTQGFFTPW